MKLKNMVMALAAGLTMSVAAEDLNFLYWMVDTTASEIVGEFSYATVRESGSSERLEFYNTSGVAIGTDMLVNNYGDQGATSGTVAGPLHTGLAGTYLDSSKFVFELWLEGADNDSLIGYATYTYAQLGKYIYSPMNMGTGNTPLMVQAVPEPTSALLLLLGVAGLALRRRRA